MAKLSDVLGINARSHYYLRLNKRPSRRIADSKMLTKEFLLKYKIPTPKVQGVLKSVQEVEEFDWLKLEDGFVIKPVEGLGGEGILVVKKAARKAGDPSRLTSRLRVLSEHASKSDAERVGWWLMDGRKITIEDLRYQARDIVEGRFSRNNLPDKALIEERVKIHPKFLKFAVGGTPDVRVIVFNKVPVMAMLRVPTAESRGKSNLHQGAIGLGIDMATGITTHGVWHDQSIRHFPATGQKVNGILVPDWQRVLETAVRIQFKRPGLAFFGVDILLDKEKGPLVIEINDQPGLAIQIANMAGLKKRLERVEGLEIDSVEKGVKVASALFAAKFAKKVGPIGGEKQTIGVYETVAVKPDKGKRVLIQAKVDTGARSTSMDKDLAEELGLLKQEHVLWEQIYKSALGRDVRRIIEVDFKMRGRRIKAKANVAKRHGLRFRMIVGRRDLKGFVVNPKLIKTKETAWRRGSKRVVAVKKVKGV